MAFTARDGSKHTNIDSMKHADAHHMAKTPQVAQPEAQPEQDGQEIDPNDRPVHTEHHAEGGHTTHHTSGAQKHTTTAEELVEHLKTHLPEEEQEIQEGREPEGY